MNIFQLLGLGLSTIFGSLAVLAVVRGRLSRHVGFSWLLVWIGVACLIVWPELTVLAADLLGIGRGADLVFYFGILAMLVGFMAVFARLRRLEASVSTLVRELAITRALQEGSEPQEVGGRPAPESAPLND